MAALNPAKQLAEDVLNRHLANIKAAVEKTPGIIARQMAADLVPVLKHFLLGLGQSHAEMVPVFAKLNYPKSRNAVIGVAHRLGVKMPEERQLYKGRNHAGGVPKRKPKLARAQPAKSKLALEKLFEAAPTASKKRERPPKPEVVVTGAKPVLVPQPKIESLDLPLMELEDGMCHFVTDDTSKSMLYCGLPTKGTYCAGHKQGLSQKPSGLPFIPDSRRARTSARMLLANY